MKSEKSMRDHRTALWGLAVLVLVVCFNRWESLKEILQLDSNNGITHIINVGNTPNEETELQTKYGNLIAEQVWEGQPRPWNGPLVSVDTKLHKVKTQADVNGFILEKGYSGKYVELAVRYCSLEAKIPEGGNFLNCDTGEAGDISVNLMIPGKADKIINALVEYGVQPKVKTIIHGRILKAVSEPGKIPRMLVFALPTIDVKKL